MGDELIWQFPAQIQAVSHIVCSDALRVVDDAVLLILYDIIHTFFTPVQQIHDLRAARCSRMIGKKQGEQIACLADCTPVFCVSSRVLADISLLIPVIEHGSSLFIPVAGKEVGDGGIIFLIHEHAKVVGI